MSWKGLVKVTFPSHLQTLMALFPKSKVLKGQVSRSVIYTEPWSLIDIEVQNLKNYGKVGYYRKMLKFNHFVLDNR